jgi:hypothetical protein
MAPRGATYTTAPRGAMPLRVASSDRLGVVVRELEVLPAKQLPQLLVAESKSCLLSTLKPPTIIILNEVAIALDFGL